MDLCNIDIATAFRNVYQGLLGVHGHSGQENLSRMVAASPSGQEIAGWTVRDSPSR